MPRHEELCWQAAACVAHCTLSEQLRQTEQSFLSSHGVGSTLPPAPPEPGVPTKSSQSVAVAALGSSAKGHGGESNGINPLVLAVAGLVLFGIGFLVPSEVKTAGGDTLSHLTVFILACFVGFQVVWSVKPALHTPLMSVTNAISGIILVGGMLQLIGTDLSITTILGAIAVLVAAINIAGGFLVTNRMLAMFRK